MNETENPQNWVGFYVKMFDRGHLLEGCLKTPTFKFGGAWKADRYKCAAFRKSVALRVKVPVSWVWKWSLKVGIPHSHPQIVPVLKTEMMLAVVDQTEDVFSPVSCQAPMGTFPNLRLLDYFPDICNVLSQEYCYFP